MKRARAALLLISIFTETRIKNHAAINARCSNLIKPFVTIGGRGIHGMLFRPCFLIRRKGSSSLPSPMEDKLKFFPTRFGKNEFAIGSFSFPSPSSVRNRKKKLLLHVLASSDRKGKFARKNGEPLCTGQFPLSFVSRWKKDGPVVSLSPSLGGYVVVNEHAEKEKRARTPCIYKYT